MALLKLLLALLLAHSSMATVEQTCSMQDGSLVDKATSISFPLELAFSSAKTTKFSLLGAGPRKKNLYVVEVNVYAVGLFADTTKLKKVTGGSLKGKTADGLAKDSAYYKAILDTEVAKVTYLKFARTVGASKVVEALTALAGVDKAVLKEFSSVLLAAIGKDIKKDETIALGWTDGALWVEVRGEAVASFQSLELANGIFDLYLGPKPISEEAKKGFAALAPKYL